MYHVHSPAPNGKVSEDAIKHSTVASNNLTIMSRGEEIYASTLVSVGYGIYSRFFEPGIITELLDDL